MNKAIPVRRRLGRSARVVVLLSAWLLAALAIAWGTLAVLYSNLPGAARAPAAVGYVVLSSFLLLAVRPHRLGRWSCAALFALVLAWWLFIAPSNERNWQPDMAVLPYADVGDRMVTIHNIRHCDYRTETEFDVRHDDRTVDLEALRTVDLFLVTWGSPNIAHTMVSFGFEDGGFVCFSIETRREEGEGYSAIKGLFKQFELAYVIADERDLLRLRTNFRVGEEVVLYRLRTTPTGARTLFLDYLNRVNSLHARPEWYNAVTNNCTTAIRAQRVSSDRAPWDWRMLINGHLDALLYERAVVATHVPLTELRERGHINAAARAAGDTPEFSQAIRRGLPVPEK